MSSHRRKPARSSSTVSWPDLIRPSIIFGRLLRRRWITGSSPVMTITLGYDGLLRRSAPRASPLIQHPLAVGAIERKWRHVDLEFLAALADHLVAAGHEAGGGRQRHAAGIFEAFAGREHR